MDTSSGSISGTVTAIFAHRFTLQTRDGTILADLTPHGLDQVEIAQMNLATGETVTIEGEAKPSEIKVHRITKAGRSVAIEHKAKKHDKQTGDAADRDFVLSAAREAGFTVHGEPRRKPKHFEILGEKDGTFSELHIKRDGTLHKQKPVDAADRKWADVLGG